MSTKLTPEEEADLAALEADHSLPVVPVAPGTVRPDKFNDFAPGLGDDGVLFEVVKPDVVKPDAGVSKGAPKS